MKILFHLGHPAHFHLFKNFIHFLQTQNHTIFILIKKKDVLENLLKSAKMAYYNILPTGKGKGFFNLFFTTFTQNLKLFLFCVRFQPYVMFGTSLSIAHIGWLLRIQNFNFNEDDFDVVPYYSKLSYPFSKFIVAPDVCSVGKWKYKTIFYKSYHELAYLHPDNFQPDIKILTKYDLSEKQFFLIRFSGLDAHHDKGIRGINRELALLIINHLKNIGDVLISTEKKLNDCFLPFCREIDPIDIHHVMAFAKIFIGDSQTMAAESGVLGVPFIRINDFVGRIGYLKELEDVYHLGYGIKPKNNNEVLEKIDFILSLNDSKEYFFNKRNKMLFDKIDFTKFILFIFNYCVVTNNKMDVNTIFEKFLSNSIISVSNTDHAN